MDLEKRLARIECKINVVARISIFVISILVGFVVYLVEAANAWAPYYGIGAATVVGLIFGSQMRGAERKLPFGADD